MIQEKKNGLGENDVHSEPKETEKPYGLISNPDYRKVEKPINWIKLDKPTKKRGSYAIKNKPRATNTRPINSGNKRDRLAVGRRPFKPERGVRFAHPFYV